MSEIRTLLETIDRIDEGQDYEFLNAIVDKYAKDEMTLDDLASLEKTARKTKPPKGNFLQNMARKLLTRSYRKSYVLAHAAKKLGLSGLYDSEGDRFYFLDDEGEAKSVSSANRKAATAIHAKGLLPDNIVQRFELQPNDTNTDSPQTDDELDADSNDNSTSSSDGTLKKLKLSTGETFYRDKTSRIQLNKHAAKLVTRMDALVRKMNESIPNSLKNVLAESDKALLLLEALSDAEAKELQQIYADLKAIVDFEDADGSLISDKNRKLLAKRLNTYSGVIEKAKEQTGTVDSTDDSTSSSKGKLKLSTGETFYRDKTSQRLLNKQAQTLLKRLYALVRKMNESVPNSLKNVLAESDKALLLLEALSDAEAKELQQVYKDLKAIVDFEDADGSLISDANRSLLSRKLSDYSGFIEKAKEQTGTASPEDPSTLPPFKDGDEIPDEYLDADGNPDWTKIPKEITMGTIDGVGVERPPEDPSTLPPIKDGDEIPDEYLDADGNPDWAKIPKEVTMGTIGGVGVERPPEAATSQQDAPTDKAGSLKAFAKSGKGGLANDKDEVETIKELQQYLTDLGFDTNGVDGKYGKGTIKGVKAFQKYFGAKEDGDAGPETIGQIIKLRSFKFKNGKTFINFRKDMARMEELVAKGGKPAAAESMNMRDLISLVERTLTEALSDQEQKELADLLSQYDSVMNDAEFAAALPKVSYDRYKSIVDSAKALSGSAEKPEEPGAEEPDADTYTPKDPVGGGGPRPTESGVQGDYARNSWDALYDGYLDPSTGQKLPNATVPAKPAAPTAQQLQQGTPDNTTIWDKRWGKTHNPDGTPKQGAEEPDAEEPGAEEPGANDAGNVDPRPTKQNSGQSGRNLRSRQLTWDRQYGKTHNPDGTPKQGAEEPDAEEPSGAGLIDTDDDGKGDADFDEFGMKDADADRVAANSVAASIIKLPDPQTEEDAMKIILASEGLAEELMEYLTPEQQELFRQAIEAYK